MTESADPFDPFQPTLAGDDGSDEPEETSEGALSFIYELPILILVALVVAVVIKTFLIQAFFIPSGSMEPTLEVDDRVLVNKLAYTFGEPGPGDVIVFDSPFGTDEPDESLVDKVTRNVAEALGLRTADAADLIKRIVAVGGDIVEIHDSQVFVNGVALDEPYVAQASSMPDMDSVEIPLGHVWVMGDNRNRSQDSRRFGAIPVDDVIGRAFVRVWPVRSLGWAVNLLAAHRGNPSGCSASDVGWHAACRTR